MSEREPMPPMDPELRRLLTEEAARGGAPAEARAQVKASMLAALAGGTGAAASLPAAHASPPQPGAPVTAVASTVAATPAAGIGWLKLGLSLLLGMGLGAGVQATLNPTPSSAPQVITKEVRVEVPVLIREPAPLPVVADDVPDAGTGTQHSKTDRQFRAPLQTEKPNVPAQPAESRDADLAAENSLISRAQAAMGRGALTAANQALRAHAERFPKGQLVEEREALSIQVQVMAGDLEGAKDLGRRFLRKYPDSPLRGAVERALEVTP